MLKVRKAIVYSLSTCMQLQACSSCCWEPSGRVVTASAPSISSADGTRRQQGRRGRAAQEERRSAGRRRSDAGAAAGARARGSVVERFAPVDVSNVERESDVLQGCLVYFVPSWKRPPEVRSKQELETLVARNGRRGCAHSPGPGSACPVWG